VTHQIAANPFAEIIMEKHAGGRWFERDSAGGECDWGKVLVWDPPKRLVATWQLQPDWKFSPDLSRASEVALEFHAESAEVTRLEFEHRHLERQSESWESLRQGVDSPVVGRQCWRCMWTRRMRRNPSWECPNSFGMPASTGIPVWAHV
jgi:activator of Hsp90 ATPase-like protein